ncbi:hypothetical protein [Desulfogranum marinum]|uniref:hypothetical protein n=1 Tax=Desulfogranum marinum TaxID=453220 RepID=UPI001962D84B|nr:hypothetical protein [Desulfogranum marinum]MBM9513713.1 hypothetical protein [Desulfogranum marinum]
MLKVLLSAGAVFFAGETFVYSMQPPLPPLNIIEFKKLVLEAELIVLGKIEKTEETIPGKGEVEKTIEITVNVEKYFAQSNCGQTVNVLETVPILESEKTLSIPGNSGSKSGQILTVFRAGPSSYHGRYLLGERVILFLAEIGKACQFRLLGSGAYDKHLCKFSITNSGITATSYCFAADLEPYAKSEKAFIQLIDSFVALKNHDLLFP